MSFFDHDRLKQFFFIIIILVLGGILFWKVSGFIPAFLGALTLYVIMRPLVIYLVYKRRWRRWIVSVLLIILSVFVLLVPMALVVNLMAAKISYAAAHTQEIIAGAKEIVERIKFDTHIDLLSDQSLQKLQEKATSFLPKFVGTTFNVISSLLIMYFLLYFMLHDSRKIEKALYEYTPLKDENIDRVGLEIKNMVLSNAVGIPMIAVVQGLICVLGYWIFGVNDYWFWGVVTGIMGMIPVIGTTIVWVPIAIYMFATGQTGMAIGLVIYSAVVVGSVDNVLRFVWQKKFADVHPTITIFGVIIGVSLFGFVGLIFGPLLISMFVLLLRIYRDEFGIKKRSDQMDSEGHQLL